MTKACATPQEAQATVAHYLQKDGTKAHVKVRASERRPPGWVCSQAQVAARLSMTKLRTLR
jgi:hypothetical protein